MVNGHIGWKRPEPSGGAPPRAPAWSAAGVPGGVIAEGPDGTETVADGDDVPGAADGDPDALGGEPELPQAVSTRPVPAVAAKSRKWSRMFMGAPGNTYRPLILLVRLSCH